ncbi:Orotate phosphoribosyltransferase [subsurface metagenome]
MSAEVESIFKAAGAILEGHFQLASGLHSATYWEKFRVLQYPHYTEQLCRMIADHFREQRIEVVAGPALGGIIVAFEVARQLGVRSIIAEREGEGRAFKRGFTISPGERALIVDDVLTTGTSVLEVIKAVMKLGLEPVGVGVLVDRSQGEVAFGVPFFSCYQVSIPTYTPEECPLCAQGVPLTKPGGSLKR